METRVGWREWVELPELGIPALKAKVDTGAKSCALHAFDVETFSQDGVEHVRFCVHPIRRRKSLVIECQAPITGRRVVRDSGGHVEERFVIESVVSFAGTKFSAEFTLTNRDDMLFPMLLGRRAMQAQNMLVDASASYMHGRRKAKQIYG